MTVLLLCSPTKQRFQLLILPFLSFSFGNDLETINRWDCWKLSIHMTCIMQRVILNFGFVNSNRSICCCVLFAILYSSTFAIYSFISYYTVCVCVCVPPWPLSCLCLYDFCLCMKKWSLRMLYIHIRSWQWTPRTVKCVMLFVCSFLSSVSLFYYFILFLHRQSVIVWSHHNL